MVKRTYETGSYTRISAEKVRMFVSAGTGLGGRRQRFTKTVVARTDAAAERALRAYCAEIEGRTAEKLNVGALIDDYLELHVSTLALQTQRWYNDTFKRIRGALGKTKLEQLTPAIIEKFYKTLADPDARPYDGHSNGVSPVTVGHHHRALSALLNWAYNHGYMTTRIIDRVTPPRIGKGEARALDEFERCAFLRTLDAETARCAMSVAAGKRNAHSMSWRVMGRIALVLGLRRGELCGLQWDDIAGTTVHICHNLQRVGGTMQLVPLKTSSSERWLELPAPMLAMLRDLRKAQLEHSLRYTIGAPVYVFTTLDGGPRDPSIVSKYFARIFTAAGIHGVTLHSVRHTCATELLQAGITPLDVSAYMGHSSTRMTLDVYGHAGQTMAQRCAAAASRMLD